jgi:hypothetical protein
VLLGVGIGIVASALFFLGLAFGMRLALRSASPIKLLSLSAALRIAGLLGIGWAVAQYGGAWAALGFGAAFFAMRLVVTTFTPTDASTKGAP